MQIVSLQKRLQGSDATWNQKHSNLLKELWTMSRWLMFVKNSFFSERVII